MASKHTSRDWIPTTQWAGLIIGLVVAGCSNVTPATRTPMPFPSPTSSLTAAVRQPLEPEMVLIPAGEFIMGSDPQNDARGYHDEQPQHTLYLPDYYIARTEVTNRQYAAFVAATGHTPPADWQAGQPPQGKEDHPVVNVAWHDALAYCGWLSDVTGKQYRLPTEAEWEKAARGTDGRIWPWGNTWESGRCNSLEGDKGDTTPVGAYPGGTSVYGLMDMAGNVSEWTSSLWGKEFDEPDFEYPYDPTDGRENLAAGDDVYRVLRGGAFVNSRRDVRCGCRDWDSPIVLGPYLGFRVAASP